MRAIEPRRAHYSALRRSNFWCNPTGTSDNLVDWLLATQFSGKVWLSWNMPGVFQCNWFLVSYLRSWSRPMFTTALCTSLRVNIHVGSVVLVLGLVGVRRVGTYPHLCEV